MGISPSLTDLAAHNDAFRQYLDALRTQLDQQAAADRSALDTDIRQFYDHSGYPDALRLAAGSVGEIQLADQFTTDDLRRSVEQPAEVDPSDASPGADAARKARALLAEQSGLSPADLWTLDAAKLLDVVGGMVTSLGPGHTPSFSTAYRTAPLGFGQQLFVAVSLSARQSPSFLDGKPVTLFQCTYEVRVSAGQATSEATMGEVGAYITLQKEVEDKLAALGADLSANRIDLDTYRTREQTYQNLLDELQRKVASLGAPAVHA